MKAKKPGFTLNFANYGLGVCRASHVKPQKIADQAIFYPTNFGSMPDNRDFCAISGAKIHKRDRLLVPGFLSLMLAFLLLPAAAFSQENRVSVGEKPFAPFVSGLEGET
jgi:hypothetical protein